MNKFGFILSFACLAKEHALKGEGNSRESLACRRQSGISCAGVKKNKGNIGKLDFLENRG